MLNGRGQRRGPERALIVEDSEDICEMLRVSFTNAGFEVEVASDGVTAMARYWTALSEGRGFDVAVLDIALPLMDGFEIAKRIRSAELDSPGGRRCRLIGYTGYGVHAAGMEKFEETGFDRLITKSEGDTELPILARNLLNGVA